MWHLKINQANCDTSHIEFIFTAYIISWSKNVTETTSLKKFFANSHRKREINGSIPPAGFPLQKRPLSSDFVNHHYHIISCMYILLRSAVCPCCQPNINLIISLNSRHYIWPHPSTNLTRHDHPSSPGPFRRYHPTTKSKAHHTPRQSLSLASGDSIASKCSRWRLYADHYEADK